MYMYIYCVCMSSVYLCASHKYLCVHVCIMHVT